MKIIEATLQDAQELRTLMELTFRETYSQENSPENIEKHVENSFGLITIQNELQSVDCKYFLVKNEGFIIAYVKLNIDKPSEGILKKAVEIERFYVLPSLKRQGIGQLLMAFCLDLAAKAKFEVIWLGVWEHNPKAIAFYLKMGFRQFGTHVFVLGEDIQTDYVLIKELIVQS